MSTYDTGNLVVNAVVDACVLIQMSLLDFAFASVGRLPFGDVTSSDVPHDACLFDVILR